MADGDSVLDKINQLNIAKVLSDKGVKHAIKDQESLIRLQRSGKIDAATFESLTDIAVKETNAAITAAMTKRGVPVETIEQNVADSIVPSDRNDSQSSQNLAGEMKALLDKGVQINDTMEHTIKSDVERHAKLTRKDLQVVQKLQAYDQLHPGDEGASTPNAKIKGPKQIQ